MSPVKGSDLAEQIELARRSIESWPQWLKDASRIGKEPVEPEARQEPLRYWPRRSASDFTG